MAHRVDERFVKGDHYPGRERTVTKMHWLVIVPKSLDEDDRRELFDRLSVMVDSRDVAVDVEDGWVIEVEGPIDLPKICTSVEEVVGVYPSSEMTLLG